MTRTSAFEIPAVHIQRPRWTPSVEQVWSSIDLHDRTATSEITTLVSVSSGEASVELQRYDWPDTPSHIEAQIKIRQPGDNIQEYIAGGTDPEALWCRLTELASAASVAAQQLQAMIDGGQWI